MNLLEHLQQVPDPRIERRRRHDLIDLLAIALCATIGGADNWVDVVQFGQALHFFFKRFLRLPSGIASHDTFASLKKTCRKLGISFWLYLLDRVSLTNAIRKRAANTP